MCGRQHGRFKADMITAVGPEHVFQEYGKFCLVVEQVLGSGMQGKFQVKEIQTVICGELFSTMYVLDRVIQHYHHTKKLTLYKHYHTVIQLITIIHAMNANAHQACARTNTRFWEVKVPKKSMAGSTCGNDPTGVTTISPIQAILAVLQGKTRLDHKELDIVALQSYCVVCFLKKA